jgi:hypothetical protein
MNAGRLVALALLLSALSVFAVACGESGTDAESSEAPPVYEPSALEHIHGLGINPADGRLYIATHNGLFAAAEDEPAPMKVGESSHDLMGFSVAGPDHFLASGHPGADQDLPPHLGLIESRDGGKTWENVSLLGQADFHALTATGRTVYGFDGTQGRLMLSGDGGRSWQERTAPGPVLGLAAHPSQASHVLVSTEEGLALSRDAGRRWRALREDLVGLLAWPAADRLYAVDGQGQVSLSADGGVSWQARGNIGGQPVAFIAHESDLYAALADGSVKRSSDGGARWSVRTTAS